MSNSVCQFYKLTLIELLQNIQRSFQEISSFSHSECCVSCNTYLDYVMRTAVLARSALGVDTVNVWQVLKLPMEGGAAGLRPPVDQQHQHPLVLFRNLESQAPHQTPDSSSLAGF